MKDDTLKTINKIMYEMHLMRDCIKGYIGCRVDLLKLKKVWRNSLK